MGKHCLKYHAALYYCNDRVYDYFFAGFLANAISFKQSLIILQYMYVHCLAMNSHMAFQVPLHVETLPTDITLVRSLILVQLDMRLKVVVCEERLIAQRTCIWPTANHRMCSTVLPQSAFIVIRFITEVTLVGPYSRSCMHLNVSHKVGLCREVSTTQVALIRRTVVLLQVNTQCVSPFEILATDVACERSFIRVSLHVISEDDVAREDLLTSLTLVQSPVVQSKMAREL